MNEEHNKHVKEWLDQMKLINIRFDQIHERIDRLNSKIESLQNIND